MTYLATGAERRAKALSEAIRFYEHGSASYGDVLIAAQAFDAWLASGTTPERTKGVTGPIAITVAKAVMAE